ncbi:hypothetical protein ACFQ34_15295 [Pseudonocardia benzenivorans]|uniref:Uncharacterized protein n=1 Tax=Pseudonocardia benzenivorans TaxID=228005 RepID=A0ABW3VHN3_9PSEU
MEAEQQAEGEVQLLVVPKGKMEAAEQAIRKLFDDEGNGDNTGPEPDATFVPDTSSATGCRRTTHHDIHCSDDT